MADLRSYITGFDLDTGAGTEYINGSSLRISGAGGSIEAKGQQVMASSIPVVVASDQGALDVDTELPAAAVLADNAGNPTTPLIGACLMVWDGAAWDRAPGTSAAGLTIDTELPAAAALADGVANPTTPLVGSCLMGWNGATWDRTYVVSDGDAVAGATTGFIVLGTDGANYQVILTDNTGKISVDIGTPANPVTSYQTSAALAAGGTVALTTAEAAAKKLTGIIVWASVACKVVLHTVDNDVESAAVAVGGFQAFSVWQWELPHRNYITLGTTGGLDAFRVNITNLDDANAADVYATFLYED